MNKQCRTCNKIKNILEFHRNKRYKDKHFTECKVCNNTKAKTKYKEIYERKKIRHKELYNQNPLKYIKRARITNLRIRFGLTLEDYNQMLINQNNKCKICGKKEPIKNKIKNLSVDHNHKTGKIRGLLCKNCNNGIGFFMDNIKFLQSAIKYLRENK